jgi:hypothetical protein
MSAPTWTLLYGGVEKSFASWGLRKLTRRQSSQSQYQVTFTGQRQPFDATPQFAYGEAVVIKKSGVQWWKGPVVSIPKYGSSQTERIDYVVASPWWYLENLTYQQPWAYYTGTTYEQKFSSHLFLGQTIDWTTHPTAPETVRAKTNVAIKEILDYARARCGNAFAYDAADLADANAAMSISIPVDECREINCAEAVRRVTKWLRDLVIWWDFTASTPVLRFQRRPALTTATLTIGAKPLVEIELTPRYDLQVSAVCLKYEKTDEVDGTPYLSIKQKFAPTTIPDDAAHAAEYAEAAEAASYLVGAMVCTVDLKGIQATNVYGSLTAAALDITDLGWWKKRYPWMLDADIESIVISGASRVITDTNTASTLPRELADGQWAPWMPGVTSEKTTINATAKVKYKPGSDTKSITEKKLSAKIITTNSPLGTVNYSTTASFDPGDEIPAGLHTDIYNSLQPLQYSGQMTLREAECGAWLAAQSISAQSGIGLKINVAGGTGAFASIGAVVQGCDEDIDSGATSLTVGPPEQLSPQDLVALLQVTRTRQIYNNPRTRAEGLTAGGGSVPYAKEVAHESASTHTTGYEKLTVSTPTTEGASAPVIVISQGSHSCNLDLADAVMTLPGSTHKINLKFRKIKYCKSNTAKNMWILCSELLNDDGSSAGEPT